MPTPKAPAGWKKRGDMPNVDVRQAPEQDLDLFDEDMLQLVDPTGMHTIDVGWYPAGSRDGHYTCRLVRSDDWEWPLEQIETTDAKTVWQWLKRRVSDVNGRLGVTGSFTTQIGLFIYQRRSKKTKGRRSITKKVIAPQIAISDIPPQNQPRVPQQVSEPERQALMTTDITSNTAMAIKLPPLRELAHAT